MYRILILELSQEYAKCRMQSMNIVTRSPSGQSSSFQRFDSSEAFVTPTFHPSLLVPAGADPVRPAIGALLEEEVVPK